MLRNCDQKTLKVLPNYLYPIVAYIRHVCSPHCTYGQISFKSGSDLVVITTNLFDKIFKIISEIEQNKLVHSLFQILSFRELFVISFRVFESRDGKESLWLEFRLDRYEVLLVVLVAAFPLCQASTFSRNRKLLRVRRGI